MTDTQQRTDGDDPQDHPHRLATVERDMTDLVQAVSLLSKQLHRDREETRAMLARLQTRRLAELPAASAGRGSDDEQHGEPVSGDGQAGADAAPAEEADTATGWAAQADAHAWEGLMDWVDWFSRTYDLRERIIFACWPLHGGVVEELAGLWMAWQQAVLTCAENDWTGQEALAYWHDRYLPGVLHRAKNTWTLVECDNRHERATVMPVTDRDVAVVQTTGQPFPDALHDAQQAAEAVTDRPQTTGTASPAPSATEPNDGATDAALSDEADHPDPIENPTAGAVPGPGSPPPPSGAVRLPRKEFP